MSKTPILIIIFLFVCWSLYTLKPTEGFQAAPPPDLNKCEIFIGTYKNLQSQYKTAVEADNQYLTSSLPPAIDNMKGLLKNMGCNVDF